MEVVLRIERRVAQSKQTVLPLYYTTMEGEVGLEPTTAELTVPRSTN